MKKNNLKNGVKKDNKSLKKLIRFYKENIMKKQIYIYIILIIVFALLTNMVISDIKVSTFLQNQIANLESPLLNSSNIISALFDKLLIVALIMISGLTPYFYLPIIGTVALPYILSRDVGIIIYNSLGIVDITLLLISSVIQLLGFSLIISTGIYLCSMYTKRYKYAKSKKSSLFDVKKKYYELKGDKENLNKINDAEQLKFEKLEELNVKPDILNVAFVFLFSVILIVISTVIGRV